MPRSGEFRFQGKQFHATFRGYIDVLDIKSRLTALSWSYKTLSVVHEEGDVDEESPTPYQHTHVFVILKKAPDTSNVRFFDIQGVHPNIVKKSGLKWAKHVVTKYHLGYKVKVDGKKYFLAPVFLHQEGCEDHFLESQLLDAVIAAPNLLEACRVAEIMPKSVACCHLLRREARKRKPTQLEAGCSKSRCISMDWDRSKALVLEGPAGRGKTTWALAQFDHPSMICQLDDLKGLPEQTDGLVFDEMLFGHTSQDTQVFVLDLAYERRVHLRFSNGTIPQGMPRIFLCNENQNVFDFNIGAVARRLTHHVMGPEEAMYE